MYTHIHMSAIAELTIGADPSTSCLRWTGTLPCRKLARASIQRRALQVVRSRRDDTCTPLEQDSRQVAVKSYKQSRRRWESGQLAMRPASHATSQLAGRSVRLIDGKERDMQKGG